MNDTTDGKRKRTKRGSGSLYKRDKQGTDHPPEWNGSGVFWIAYTPPGTGKRIRQALTDIHGKPITDRKQAENERRRIMAPYTAGGAVEALRGIQAALRDATEQQTVAVEQAGPFLTVQGGWQAFIDHPNRPRCSDSTLKQYAAEWRRFQSWIEKAHPEAETLKDITRQHGVEYASDLDAAGVTASTFNQHVNLLALVWQTLADRARLAVNPFDRGNVKRRKLAALANRKRALTPAQYEALLAAAESDPDMRDLFTLLAWTGQRLVDVVMMPWGAVDFAKGVITLYPRKTAQRTGRAVHPPLFPAAREVLNRRQDPGKPYRLDALIFPDLAELYQRDAGATLTKRIGRIFEKAGLTTSEKTPGAARAVVRYGAHSFRHFYVTQAAAAGVPGAVIKAVTGHSTDDMLTHYQHIGEEHSAEIARRIGNGTDIPALPARPPLPTWARELIESATAETWESVRAELLAAG